MLKIDIHTHILPKHWPDLKQRYGYGGFIKLCHHDCGADMVGDDGRFFRTVQANSWDPQVRIQECDEHAVGIQVLSTVPVMFCYWTKPDDGANLAKLLNDHIATVCAEHPKRFVGLATLPMQSPELSIKELERCVKELGLVGVQIGSHVMGKNLDDPGIVAVLEACQDLGACVFVHPWDMLGQDRMRQYWFPWLLGMPTETALAAGSLMFGGVLAKLPRLRVAFAHGGGSLPLLMGRLQHGFEMRPDLCQAATKVSPRESLKQLYFDTLVHDALALRYLLDLVGAERLALGTDYPFPLGELTPGKLIEDLSPDIQEQLLYKTAATWLGRDMGA